MSAHGYLLYTHGCRCEVCKAAKAAYMRSKRAAAKAAARGPLINEQGRHVAPGDFKHGTAHGYKDHACRCLDCSAWKTTEREKAKGRKQYLKLGRRNVA